MGEIMATRARYCILAILSMAPAGAYLTRNMAAMNTTIAEEFGYEDSAMGVILAGFFFGYIWFQVPGAWAGTRFGVRFVLPLMSLAWSLATVSLSLARSDTSLFWSRVALGAAQAGLVSCSAQALALWFPVSERGTGAAAIAASMQVGALLAMGLTPALLLVIDWRTVFMAYASVGAIWSLAFFVIFRDRPQDHAWVNRAELALIEGAARDQTSTMPAGDGPRGEPIAPASPGPAANFSAARPAPWQVAVAVLLAMVTSGSMWALCSQAYFRAFGYDFFISWFPAYLERARGVTRFDSSLLTMAPIVAVGLGSVAGGFLVDALLRWTGSKRISRSGTAASALAGCAVCTLSASWISDPKQAVVLISIGTFLAGLAAPATWSAMIDISGKHTAVVSAIQNMVGNLGAGSCSYAIGRLFSHIRKTDGDWNLVLYVFVGIYLAGAGFWLVLDPNRSAVERRNQTA
jgi:sugar phosphate permease